MRRLVVLVALSMASVGAVSCTPMPTPTQAVRVAAGGTHSCAVLANQTVQCWGDDDYGQLGNGSTTNSSTPVVVTGVSGAGAISAGEDHTCVVVTGGTVSCWGRNDSGQLGNGTTTGSSTAVTVTGLSHVVAIAAGASHTCAIVDNSGVSYVVCWGANGSGQLGDDQSASSSVPVTVSSLSNVVAIGAGANTTCAVVVGGTVECWGDNTSGKLGNGSSTLFSNVPSPVSGLTGVAGVAVGRRHACANTSAGALWCWGDESIGELGNGVATAGAFSNVPVAVTLPLVSQVSAGSDYTCAALVLGGLNCWGRNDLGQLGIGTTTSASTPVAPNLTGVEQVAAGDGHACALTNVSTVRCWGWNGSGQVGNGTNTNELTSVEVTGL